MQNILVGIAVFFAVAIGAYYAVSPYENCIREFKATQSPELANNEMYMAVLRGNCAKLTNW